jgi:hypothetical protein
MKSVDLRATPHRRGRRTAGRAQLDHVLDPYRRKEKLPNGTRCPKCGAVVHEGRWAWTQVAQSGPVAEALCPADRRINDRFPAGLVTLTGAFARAHRAELVRLARRQEELEKPEHALDRIMAIEDDGEGVTISTTDIHLPRRIGEAIRRAWRGELTMAFEQEGYFVRVQWRRDDTAA